MASRWHMMSKQFGQTERLVLIENLGRNNGAALLCRTARRLSSALLSPRSTTNGKDSKGLYHLTQLFGKFLRSGDDKQAAHVMKGIASFNGPATVVVCNYLLNSCSKTRNAQMAKEVWGFMVSNSIQMNNVSYGSMLCALTRGGCLEEAVDLLHLLYKKKEANVVMYNIVLNGCTHAKSKMYAARCVQLMEAQGVVKDELSYVELIKLSGMLGDLDATKQWWKELISNFAPNPSSRSPYIVALSRMEALIEARQELQDLVSDLRLKIGTQTDEERVNHQSSDVKSSVSVEQGVKGLGHVDGMQAEITGVSLNLDRKRMTFMEESNGQVALKKPSSGLDDRDDVQFPRIEESSGVTSSAKLPPFGRRVPKNASTGMQSLQNAYNSLLNAAGKTGDHLLAEALFTEMRQLGLKTDIYTYNALLRAVVDGRGVEHALRIVRRMEASGLRPNVHSLTALIEGYCQRKQLDKAEDILNYMENGDHNQQPSCYSYNILLKACAVAEDPLRALKVFARMKRAGVAPDNCTYITLLSACGNVHGSSQWSQQEVTKRVTAIEMDMAQSGLQHTHKSLTAVMNVLGTEGLTEAMLQRLQDASGRGESLLDVTSFNTVILSCLNSKQVEAGWDIYNQMKSAGVKPDVYTYNILINGCARDKDVSTAFGLVDEMRQAGLSPDLVTFNSLLKVVCHSGEMEIVLDFLEKMTASGVPPGTATFNTILTSASYHKRLEVTEHVLEDMRRRNILPDQHTLLPVVSIYMHVGQTDDAVEALRVLSLRMLNGNKADQTGEIKVVKTKQIQTVLGDLARKNLNLCDETRGLLMDAVLHTSPESLAIYTAALSGLVHGDNDSWESVQSSWEARLATQYDKRGTSNFSKI